MSTPGDGAASVPVRVFLRPVGTPLTIGMAGLAVGSLVQGGFDVGWLAKGQQAEVGLILLSAPFILQLVACVFAYLARDGAAGAALGVLATTWLAIGIEQVHGLPGTTSPALGLLLLASAAVLTLSAVTVASAKLLPAAIFALAAVRFALAGIYQLSGVSAWQQAAGIIGLIVLTGAAYGLLAFELEGQRRRPVLPTLRRGQGRSAVTGDAADQVDEVIHEAGVRRTI